MIEKKKIAVIGSGPAGIEVSRMLLAKNYEVHVFEKLKELGGLYIFGVPDWRINKERIEERIEELKEKGLKSHTGIEVGKDITLDELLKKFNAIILATGAWKPRMIRCEGVELKGVFHAFDYLTRLNLYKKGYLSEDKLLRVKGKTFVVGAGDVAMDAAREARREGAEVCLLYRRSRAEMPCSEEEFKNAEKEGISFRFLVNIKKFIGNEKGYLTKIQLIRMKLGEPDESGRPRPIPIEGSEFEIQADTCILATGEIPTPPFKDEEYGIKLTKKGAILTDKEWHTTRKGVFAIGDLATGPANFGTAIKSAIECAKSVDDYLKTGEWPKNIS